MRLLSTMVECAGLALIVAAAAVWDWRLGAAVAGLVLVLVGFALDRSSG